MNSQNLNASLRIHYEDYLKQFNAVEWDETVSHPLLMHVYDEYCEMNKKILIVGLETHGWGEKGKSPVFDELLLTYQNFNLGKTAYYKRPRYLTSPFWNFSRSLFFNLNEGVADVSKRTNGFLWTNISKFDNNRTTPSDDHQKKSPQGFHLLAKEIEILKPDIVIFLTNWKYNDKIKAVFKPTWKEILPDGFLNQLSTTDHSLPVLTFQTKHPAG